MSSPLPPPPPPGPLGRSALERILARAAELQAGSSEQGEAGEGISETQLIEIGKEVGLSPEHLRHALAEERTRVVLADDDGGVASSFLGIGRVGARRVVPGSPADLLSTIDDWMQREEFMVVKRRQGARVIWEVRRDVVAAFRRALNVGGRGYPLARCNEVSATVTAIDDKRALVALDADLTEHRYWLGWQATAAGATGLAASGVLAVIGVMIPVAAVPVVVVPALGVFLARQLQSRVAVRAQVALEQVLDRLERADYSRPPSLLGAIAAAAVAAATNPRKRA